MSIQILSFNTTTELCSVAIMVDKRIYNYNVVAPRLHAEKILPMIHRLLVEVGITLRSLDCIIFDRGPGSFMGVRLGISIAQGLAFGSDLPLVDVSSLSVLAQGARRMFSAKRIITTIDARMNELYWSFFYDEINNGGNDNNWIKDYCNNEFLVTEKMSKEWLGKLQNTWVLVGTGWNNYSSLMYINVKNDPIILRCLMYPEAQDMFVLGICKWQKKSFVSPEKISPIYLRDKIAVKV